jgi:hypothetical protein
MDNESLKESITLERIDELLRFLAYFQSQVNEFYALTEPKDLPDGSFSSPFYEYSPEVLEFWSLAQQTCWCDPNYTQKSIDTLIDDDNFVACADIDQIRSILTWADRGERFSEGLWAKMIDNGKIAAVLKRLETLREDITSSHYS